MAQTCGPKLPGNADATAEHLTRVDAWPAPGAEETNTQAKAQVYQKVELELKLKLPFFDWQLEVADVDKCS